ncbi:hypothetical protein ACP4OV_013267 [Aristida adscensionis]
MDNLGSSSSRPLRIVIFPFLGFGFMLPDLEFAERLASRGHHVSFVSTSRNIARLPPVRPAAAPRLDLVALPLPRVDGLGEAESTNEVHDEILWNAFDGLAAPFAEFLGAACAGEGTRPDWIISDAFNHLAATVGQQHKVPSVILLPSAAWIVSWWSDPTASLFDQPAEERPADVPCYEWTQKAGFFAKRGRFGLSYAQRCTLTLECCTITAMRSCPEWEPEAFPRVATLLGKPLVPLGLLPPSPDGGRRAADDDAALRWLDAQPARSVLYVALGSEVPLRVELVHELALGLELAGTPFLWALRKPSGVLDADILPPGFHKHTDNNGFVAMQWVPQISILAHGAVGAFLTHCGRNSIAEGLLFGNPLIMLPIRGDQGSNARFMEGTNKVGLQVPRDEDTGSFDRQGVAKTVRAVMLEEKTRSIFVANALKLKKEIVANKELQERYVDEFSQKLGSFTTNGNSNTAAPPPADA